ncbi:MAG: type II secretion system protein GspG [Planctomycetes bacterium]|nr:type II secretion system protein GspG [Planctomycetota bacterium]
MRATSVRTCKSEDAGFTLVEVIVVLSVVLLLTGIAVPMLSSYLEDGRRARAESEVRTIASAVLSLNKDVGVYPARNSSGVNNYVFALMSGPSMPTSNPFVGGHTWVTWAMNATRGDLLDNQLLHNTPQGQSSAAYPTSGSAQWRGPYMSGSPLDPWGRPYLVNVRSGFDTNATNNKKLFVLSAGPNGRIETPANASSTAQISGDDVGFLVGQRR